MNREKTGFQALGDESAEHNPGSADLSLQDILYSLALGRTCPFVNIKHFSPTACKHLLGTVVKDNNIEVVEGDSPEFPFFYVDRPMTHATLVRAELFK